MAIFSKFFFRQYRPGKCLFRYSRTKNFFLGYKRRSSKSRKIDIFPKGLTYGFGQEIAIFFNFLFIGQVNVFYDILEQKNAFLGYKNKKFKKSKTCNFFKGGQPMVLVQKLPYFQLFF